MSMWIGIALLVIAATALMFSNNPGAALGLEDSELARLVSGIALLIVLGSSLMFSYRGRASLALKQAVTWVAMGLVLIAVYSYRAEFMQLGARMTGELLPGKPVRVDTGSRDGKGTVAIAASANGHFNVEALVNNTHVKLIADTGATVIALTHEDAQRIGLRIGRQDYTVAVSTANGRTLSAPVKLDEVRVGSITLNNVSALVAQPGKLRTSLLGMSFLGSLSSFEISGSRLVLRQ